MNPDNLGNWARDFATMIHNTTLNSFDGPAHLRDVYDLLNDAYGVGMVSGREWDYLVTAIEQKFNAFGWKSSRPR